MRKILSILLSLLVFAGLAGAVYAQNPPSIVIPVDTVIYAKEGSRTLLANETVDANLGGQVCAVTAKAKNQGSVHPGNDIEIASNGNKITLFNVERAPGVDTEANGTLKLGADIDVTLVMGQDEVFSAGMDVTFDCQEEPEPPVFECTSLTAIAGSDPKSFTFTTKTKVSDGILVEKYVYDFNVAGESPVTTDEATITKVYKNPGTYNVSVEVFFNVDDENSTDICKTTITVEEPPVEPPVERPKVLPATGPGAVIAGAFGLTSLGFGAYTVRASRANLRDKILGKD